MIGKPPSSWREILRTPLFYRPESGLKKNSIRNVSSAFYKQGKAQNNLPRNDVIVLCKQGQLREALRMLRAINRNADSFTYASLLQACIKKKAFSDAKLVHTLLEKSGIIPDKFLRNTLINLYVKYESLVDARRVFDEMPERDVCSWTAMVAAYSRNGYAEESLALFRQMKKAGIQANHFTFASVLPACGKLADLQQGIEVHEEILSCGIECDVFVENAIIDMYAKCGRIAKARDLFDKMRHRDVVSWNTMIAGYVHNGLVDEGFKLFQKMPEPDIISWNAMIAGFAQNGCVDEAFGFFKKMQERNVVSWNAMIAGYAKNGHGDKALNLFHQMQREGVKPDLKTFTIVLQACAGLAALEQGVQIHEEIVRCGIQIDEYVENALVDMYAKCGKIEKARELFDKRSLRNVVSWNTMIAGYEQIGKFDEALNLFHQMPEPDIVSCTTILTCYMQNGRVDDALKLFQRMPEQDVASWTALISGYVQNGKSVEALSLFGQMQVSGVLPEPKTYVCILPACADLAALEQGIQIHEEICERGLASNVFLVNALLDMYAKCGSIERAQKMFENMNQKNIVSWTTMIAGYAMHGYGKEALELFEKMQRSGMNPDSVTLVCLLCACCHAGLVNEGWQYFDCITRQYHIIPAMEHYVCMIDLLGRAGYLDEALDFINNMPIKPDATVWRCLLGACSVHTNVELGEYAAERLFELDSENAAPYVLLSNIYAAADRWGNAESVRKVMKERRIKKTPGYSWIEVNKQVHTFLAEDSWYQ